jgi:thiol-disulfide isomerase/thioredoxin
MLLGEITVDEFQDTSFQWWYKSEYEFYQVDSTALSDISINPKDTYIDIYMGTWCSDSRREVPRFIKIMESLGFDNYHIYAVDRDKHSLNNEAEGKNIELVPTIIFYENSEEIGRIIESPMETLELDMAEILNNKKPSSGSNSE